MSRQPRRGDLVFLDLGEQVGHEAAFEWPALVVSHDRLTEVGLVTVLPVTRRWLGYPSYLELEPTESSLRETSYVQTEQPRTVSTTRVIDVLQTLPYARMRTVNGLLRTNLALD